MQRKRLGWLVLSALLLGLLAGGAGAAEPIVLEFTIGETTYMMNGESRAMDVAPLILEGRTLLPIRYVAEPLGASVSWDAAQKKATVALGSRTIELWVGRNLARVGGVETPIDPANAQVVPVIINSRTFLPLRFVSEALGAEVAWDSAKKRATVTYVPAGGGQVAQGIVMKELVDQNGIPAVRLGDGRIVPLLRLDEVRQLERMAPLEPVPPPPEVKQYLNPGTPPAVDLREYQTPIRDQQGRGTCVTFAVVAGIEAKYNHLDRVRYRSLDLSEQYGNHLQKMVHLRETVAADPSWRENQLGRWGGGNTLYSAALFKKLYRLPPESLLPYNGDWHYGTTDEPGDVPYLTWTDERVHQRQVDDLNFDPAEFPQAALRAARYGITSYGAVPDERRRDPLYYEAILAGRYEVMFMAELHGPDPTPGDLVWNPGPEPWGGHAMLMVGYDKARRVFIVKNSWGYDNPSEGGFTLVSYDYVTRGHVSGGAYIVDVERSPDTTYRTEQLLLGRWKLDHDGWQGLLDLYRLSGFFRPESIGGMTDRRLGTYFHADGRAYRVNGTVDASGRIEFYIDFSRPNRDYDDLTGKKFTGYLFTHEDTYLAGTLLDTDGKTYGFYATREGYLAGTAAGTSVDFSAWIGHWEMNHDGWHGRLTIWSVNPQTGLIQGEYVKDNQAYKISGQVDPANKRHIQFNILFSPTQPFDGYMYSWERGVMSGTTVWSGRTFGFVARRVP